MSLSINQSFYPRATSDGAGVKLSRIIDSRSYAMTNPFVMLDLFDNEHADDYIAGFPSHPHKGFDTITFMLSGKMTHQDSLGNQKTIGQHQVQWMRTNSGIIHSEMPEQTEGKLRGFQFWLNIPAADKHKQPEYIEYDSLVQTTPLNNTLRVIAGQYQNAHTPYQPAHTQANIVYIDAKQSEAISFTIPKNHQVLVYLLSGSLSVLGEKLQQPTLLSFHLSNIDESLTLNLDQDSECLVFHAQPIDEPMIQHGPFVMNTQEEITQAINDYRHGNFV